MLNNEIIDNQSDKNLVATLEDLGYLPNNFQGGFLYNLLEHKNPKIRFLAAKNIAKLNQIKSLEPLWDVFQKENDTTTKREIVSAIGRLRREQNKPYLFEILQDNDPKVVCQAIRGLLVYDNDVFCVIEDDQQYSPARIAGLNNFNICSLKVSNNYLA